MDELIYAGISRPRLCLMLFIEKNKFYNKYKIFFDKYLEKVD